MELGRTSRQLTAGFRPGKSPFGCNHHVVGALSSRGPSARATTARGCGTLNKHQQEADWSRRPVANSAALSDSETVISLSGAVSPMPSAFTYASFLVQPFRNADTGSRASLSSRRSTSENTRRASDSTSLIGRWSSRCPLRRQYHRRVRHCGLRCVGSDHSPPVVLIVGEELARRTASAIATSTSREPSKGSLACAVRTLSTSIRSPACHGSRAVLAS